MDELLNFCKSALATGLGVFAGVALWYWAHEHQRRRQYRAGLERAMQRAGERMEQPGGGVEFIPVEEWPDSLEVRDK